MKKMYAQWIVTSALFAGVIAAPNRKCVVGDWGEWGGCKHTRGCSPHDHRSFSMETADWDTGRIKMAYMMEEKEKFWRYQDKCLAEGTCPEFVARKSAGPEPCVNGMSGENPCRNIDQLSFVDFNDLGYVDAAPGERQKRSSDIWGWTDTGTGDEYALIALSGGTSFVRITDPENPVPVGFLYTETVASIWRDLKTIGNYVYIVSEAADHGIQIFDLTKLRNLDSLVYFGRDDYIHYGRIGNAHNIVANEDSDYIYVVGATKGDYDICRGGLHVVDVRVPEYPRMVGCFGEDGYVHDAQCLFYNGPDAEHRGREICLCFNENSFTIVDVHDKDNMFVISKEGYLGYAYTHQGWMTDDHKLVLLDDEMDERRNTDKRTRTYMWDVTDMDKPVLRRTYYSTETSIDHNLYIRDNLAYQSNYQAGLRILDIDQDNFDLTEVAYFDVFPSSTAANFNGAWSVYNYFPSKTVIVSSIEYGLYVLRPDYEAIEETLLNKSSPYGEETRMRKLAHREEGCACPPLVESRECQPGPEC